MNPLPLPRIGSLLPQAAIWLATIACLAAATTAQAQDSAALLRLLVQKGIVTEAEAQALVEEAGAASPDEARAPAAASGAQQSDAALPPPTRPASIVPAAKGWPLERLSLSGRLQVQYAGIGTDIDGAPDPDSVSHFFMRRAYLGVNARLVDNVSSVVTYDFASGNFDAAYIGLAFTDALSLDVGLTKAPFGFEEFHTSSGGLKAIERSAVTRYFVEPNNSRRLGAGVYRIGAFLDGKQGNWQYSLALTNPERVDSPTSAGSGVNNGVAAWGFLGYKQPTARGYAFSGLSLGYLPEQGGKTLGAGNDLAVAAAFLDLARDNFRITGELMWSDNERGASETRDANSWGFFTQPSYRFSERWEGVARYSYVDSDGRGINLSDALRSAPGGGAMDKLHEAYLGASWLFNGDNFKWQCGLVYGKSKDALSGAPAEAESLGVRSMLQLQY